MTETTFEPTEISLQSWCVDCQRYCRRGRQWCQANVWRACEHCGQLATKYVRSDSVEPQP